MLIVGIALRLLMVLRGHNSDLLAWHEIGASPLGNNLYQTFPVVTNWGPPLYWMFQICYRLPGGHDIGMFHLYVAIFFCLCDLFSATILLRAFGLLAAGIFLFTPAEAVVSGFHCNVEPALIACIMAALYFATLSKSPWNNELFYLMIGLSLTMKHAFIFFPLWLFMQPATRLERAKSVLIPYGTMLLVLLPYSIPHPMPVVRNIVFYSSFGGNGLIPMAIKKLLGLVGLETAQISSRLWLVTFIGPLLLIGWMVRRRDRKELVLIYAPALVGLSSAIALQYLALPAYSFAACPSIATWIYNLLGLYLFGGHPSELHFYQLPWKLTMNFDNRAWQFLQWLCLIWVGMRLRSHRRKDFATAGARLE